MQEQQQRSKLFVGNLDYSVEFPDLKQLFSQYGTVGYVKVVQGRGFGFVEMENAAEAENAMRELNGKEFKGRNLNVDVAKPQEPRQDRGGRGDRGGQGAQGAERGNFGEGRGNYRGDRGERGTYGGDRGNDRGGYGGGRNSNGQRGHDRSGNHDRGQRGRYEERGQRYE